MEREDGYSITVDRYSILLKKTPKEDPISGENATSEEKKNSTISSLWNFDILSCDNIAKLLEFWNDPDVSPYVHSGLNGPILHIIGKDATT